MADALISIAMKKLISITQQEFTVVVGVTEEVEKLSSKFEAIRAVINDAESRQVKEASVRDWLRRLKDVAYDMDDVLDECTTEDLGSQIDDKKRIGKKRKKVPTYSVLFPCFFFNQVELRHNIGHRIKILMEKLDAIYNEKDKYKFCEDHRIETTIERETSSLIDEREIFGRNEDKEAIVSLLLSESSEEEIGTRAPIMSIIGMGGLGKTTLAQQVFNDDKVKTHFDTRIWVCVSEDFDVKRLVKAIIEDVTKKACDSLELNPLQEKLCEILGGKRFLLVLDDVWEENEENCEKLKLPFEHGAQGSRVVLTTRNERVAMVMGTTHLHKLGVLPEEDCWSIFSYKAFRGRAKEECSKLVEIGMDIVKKCKGVPLAAKVIGCAMRFKRTKQDWERVLESELWDLEEIGEGIYPALMLSYYNLPSKLKQCFAYCSIFPKDYKMECVTLVKLWMAQGFISSEGENQMEEIGREYFNDLLGRCLFQDAVRDDDGNAVTCKMHDLVHDLARFNSRGELYVMEGREQYERQIRARHLVCYNLASDLPDFQRSDILRTLVWRKWGSGFFSQFRCLRVLDLSYSDIEELSSSVDKLKHLRYLDLSRTYIQEMPKSVTALCNLQTVKLYSCRHLRKLPEGIGNLMNLRHLEFKDCGRLCYIPKDIERLGSLRTLSRFIIGGSQSECKIGALKDLNLLQGSLEIVNLDRVASGVEANEVQLGMKKNLHRLVLSCEGRIRLIGGEVERMEDVFESLRPNANLSELKIENYIGSKFPSWMEDPLFRSLIKVELVDCRNCVQLPALGRLPLLRHLHLQKCRKLEVPLQLLPHTLTQLYIGDCKGDWMSCIPLSVEKLTLESLDLDEMQLRQLSGLINLQFLKFRTCDYMTSLPDGIGKLEKLESLHIDSCFMLSSLPNELQQLTSLQRLNIISSCPILTRRCQKVVGEDWLKIAHIPTIFLDHPGACPRPGRVLGLIQGRGTTEDFDRGLRSGRVLKR